MDAIGKIAKLMFALVVCMRIVASSFVWLRALWPGHDVLAKLIAETFGLLSLALLLAALFQGRPGLTYALSFVMQRPFLGKGDMLRDVMLSILFGISTLFLVLALKSTVQLYFPAFVDAGLLKTFPAASDVAMVGALGKQDWLELFPAFLIGATFEECVFRGILFGYLWRNHSLWLAAVLSVALFGFFHGVTRFAWTVLDGALYLALYLTTRRLSSCIAAHCAHNLFVYLRIGMGWSVGFVPNMGSYMPALLGWGAAGFIALHLFLTARRRSCAGNP